MYKKIIGLGLAALVLLSLTAAGTWAFFSDTETNSGNNLAAGTLDLQVGADDPMSESIILVNIQPGDADTLASWSVTNIGSLRGNFSLEVGAVSNAENGLSEVEISSGDTTADSGELGDRLILALWMDNDSDGWSDGDYYLDPSGSSLDRVDWSGGSSIPPEAYFTLNLFSEKSSAALQNIAAGATAGDFRVEFRFPETGTDDNQAQSDTCTFDILFTLKQ